jgi:pimeloyl-ACP methyl ester carboxylesterase
MAELANLIDHLGLRDRGYCLLGQSWGGMVSGAYACRRPQGLRKLIIAGGPASIPLVFEGYKTLIPALPEDVRATIDSWMAKGDFESEEFEKTAALFYERHICSLDPMPEEIQTAFKNLKDDPTAYLTL